MEIKLVNRIWALIIAAVMTTAFSTPAFAENEIGNFLTDEPESGSGSEENETVVQSTSDKNRIALSNGVSYDRDDGLFYFSTENSSFGVSVPSGAVVTGAVRTEIPQALTATLYKSGVKVEGEDLSAITEPGKYILAVSGNDSTKAARVNFTIVSSPTGVIKEYQMPSDFFIVSATLNGEEATYSQTLVDMRSDGDYVVNYRLPEANKDFKLELTVDHTPPKATVTGLTDGKANGPVTITDLEDDVKAYVTRNGKQIEFNGTLNETGAYVVTLQDAAGNETVYDFVIVTYANGGLKSLITMGGVLAFALAGFLLYYRKNIRVS